MKITMPEELNIVPSNIIKKLSYRLRVQYSLKQLNILMIISELKQKGKSNRIPRKLKKQLTKYLQK